MSHAYGISNNHCARQRCSFLLNLILSLPSCTSLINSVRSEFSPAVDVCENFFVILGENVKERRARNSCLHRDDTGRVWGYSLLFQRNEAYTPYTLELARVRVVNFFISDYIQFVACSSVFIRFS